MFFIATITKMMFKLDTTPMPFLLKLSSVASGGRAHWPDRHPLLRTLSPFGGYRNGDDGNSHPPSPSLGQAFPMLLV